MTVTGVDNEYQKAHAPQLPIVFYVAKLTRSLTIIDLSYVLSEIVIAGVPTPLVCITISGRKLLLPLLWLQLSLRAEEVRIDMCAWRYV